MSAFGIYKNIQAFKASRTAILNGVNYANVVAPFLYDQTVIGFLKKFVFSFFFATRVIAHDWNGNGLLLYYSCRHKQRADYDYIPTRLREIFGGCCDYMETSEKFSLIQLFYTLKELPNAWRSAKGYQAKKLQQLGCALLIAKYRVTAERIFTTVLRGKRKLITFCDAQAPENLLAQMGNNEGIETFTNQHGQYRILDDSNISCDAEAYSNFVSNYMLCWGEATRKEFVRAGFHPEQIIVSGWIKQWFDPASHPPCGVFGVMLNGENGRASNEALLVAARIIAKSLNLHYLVRLHPWSKASQYATYLCDRCNGSGHYDLSTYLNMVDFSIAHMTAAVIEILHSGALVYLLDDDKLAEVFRVPGLSFSAVELMINAIRHDLGEPLLASDRIGRLSRWYNDDCAQVVSIRSAILAET